MSLIELHRAAGRQQARQIIAHPERHGPQRIMVAWCALNGVRRMPPAIEPQPRRDWWREAAVISAPDVRAACAGEPGREDGEGFDGGDVA